MREGTAATRNFLALTGDIIFFTIGMSFASQTTVLPSFLAKLTSSPPVIGLASTLASGAWLLPQLFAANAIAGKPRRKPGVLAFCAISRLMFLAITPLVTLLGPSRPNAILVSFFALYTLFWAFDGFASVGWLDILGKCLNSGERARLISVGQAGGAGAGILVGILVGVVLASSRFIFPGNYVLLFLASGVAFSVSLLSFTFLKEEPEETGERPLPLPAYFRRLAQIARNDRDFRKAVAVHLLCGMIGMAMPFFVIYGLEELHFGDVSVGIFTSANVAGGIASALVIGYLGVKRGTRSVMRLWSILAACAPVVALGLPLLLRGAPAPVPMYAYAIVFVIVGAQGTAMLAGFRNYVIELAPPSRRATYIGFANALNGILLVAPLLGGWLLSVGLSYPALFAVSAILPIAGLLVSRGLAEPRTRGAEKVTASE